MANIGHMIGGGFGLVARRPLSVLTWGLVSAAGGIGLAWVQFRLTGPMDLESMLQRAAEGPQPGQFALSLMLNFASLVITTILSAAAFRAVLRPEERGFASIRLGMDEVRMLGITLLLYALAIVATVLGALGFAFVVSLMQLITGGDSATAQMLAGILGLALMVAVVFVVVRLSLVYPLVLVHRRIGIDASWDLTRGHFWSLLGAYILMALISFGLMLLILAPMAGLAIQGAQGAGFEFWNNMMRPLAEGDWTAIDLRFGAMMAAGLLLNALLLALWSGMLGTATLELLEEKDPDALEYDH